MLALSKENNKMNKMKIEFEMSALYMKILNYEYTKI